MKDNIVLDKITSLHEKISALTQRYLHLQQDNARLKEEVQQLKTRLQEKEEFTKSAVKHANHTYLSEKLTPYVNKEELISAIDKYIKLIDRCTEFINKNT